MKYRIMRAIVQVKVQEKDQEVNQIIIQEVNQLRK